MSRQIVLPELAESVVEGEILKWLVQEGETVALEQPICEVMTDKVTVELPSPYAGTLEKHLVAEGGVVAVHAPIALISDAVTAAVSTAPAVPGPSVQQGRGEGAAAVATLPAPPIPAQEEQDTSLFKAFVSDETVQVSGLRGAAHSRADQEEQKAGQTEGGTLRRVLAVPAARQLARELGVDLTQVSGSGTNGRIKPLDIHQHVQKTAQSAGSGQSGVRPAPGGLGVPPVTYRTPKGYEHLERRVPLRGMRRAISTQMQASHLYTVRTLTVDEANLTRLVELRSRLNAELAGEGQKLSYLPFIFKAVVAALKKYPSLNTSLDESSGEIVQKDYYHLGMAVTTDVGLTVPVIRDADRRTLLELGQQVNLLADRARLNKLTPDELTGSSFSITNIGSVGALFSFPIINVPDAAILGVHSIVRRPIVTPDGQIVAADMMYLSLSFDHRLVDGAEAARFCKEIIRLLENPERLMVSI
ncbi:dihydrolipoamide acetyltransferase family protein [Deinococcus ruber]|uniref:Dihydrolipoamide acetyltransferase component of pyruvate dehydrogenase complex n=1 Tax=Deinococcus ruber TaxID=1848197 RepID=A0A918F2Q1_9DEIO|nr:dihydrolipoamide acetyltransferase family protein [Deinococcus ruber]GGR02645.1 dihydrolipoamide acetyltransferase component of pyruvate dehydrogenase complex [Deinococcus ruber]